MTDRRMVNNSVVVRGLMIMMVVLISALTGFEKLTDLDYRGNTYYSIRNLSLHECQGWCRQEPECAAAAFR